MAIKELLLIAATSPYQLQRNSALQQLNQSQKINVQSFFQQLFYLLCYHERTINILAYSYFKQLLIQSQKQTFANLNQSFEKAFFFWENQNLERSSIQEIFIIQRQNIIQLASRYLSLSTSSKFRESFINEIAFKLYNKFQTNDLKNLEIYLKYYSKIIQNLLSANTCKTMTRKSMMGALMVNKIIPLIKNQNIYINSLWVGFFIYYGRYCEWIPDKNYLIEALNKFQISKATIISLSQFLVDKVLLSCSLEDSCRILIGLQKAINLAKSNLNNFSSRDAQILLKSYRGFLHQIFCSKPTITEQYEAMCLQFLHSYQHFSNILSYIMLSIQHYTIKSEEIEGYISPMLTEYSTQIINLYSEYLQNQRIVQYINQFKNNFQPDKYFEKMLILLSGMPKSVLQLFNYEEVAIKLLSQQFYLKEEYQIIYLNFLLRYISVNAYLDSNMIQKICFYLVQKIKKHEKIIIIYQNENSQNNNIQIMTKLNNEKGLISEALNVLSHICKFKLFCDHNQNFFSYLIQNSFKQLLQDSNYLSIISQSFDFIIKQQNKQWNNYILNKSIQKMSILSNLNQVGLNRQKVLELYRICKKTMNIQNLIQKKYLQGANASHLNFLIELCTLQHKDEILKEEILYNLQEILLQINIFNKKYVQNSNMFQQILQSFITIKTFEQIQTIFRSTCILEEMQIGNIQKVDFKQQEYLILPQKLCNNFELHTSCIKILIELTPYKKYFNAIMIFLQKNKSVYLNCLWQAMLILYNQEMNSNLVPEVIKVRVDKIKNGNIVELFEQIGLNQYNKFKSNNKNHEWFYLYREIVNSKSIVNQLINNKIEEFLS